MAPLPLEPIYWPLYGPALLFLFHLVPWLRDPLGQRNIPGPIFAQFSDWWLALAAYKGKRSETVHRAHVKYGKPALAIRLFPLLIRPIGPVIRIAPNHISIANPDALQIVYGHQSRTLKSDFYDAFVSITRGLFNTRSRPEHARKRKMVSALFSTHNVTQFEFNIRECLTAFVGQFDRLAAEAALNEGHSGKAQKGDAEHGAWVWMDVLSWFNYLAFDIIGDLAFGSPFGMIKAGRDVAHVAVDHNAAFGGQGLSHAREKTKFIEVPAIEILNRRGEFSAFLGVLRPWTRYFRHIQHPPKRLTFRPGHT
jgi:benzoate 4-monooxygenase